jgi:hypothetical protein
MDSDDVKSINPLQPTSCFETKHSFFLQQNLSSTKMIYRLIILTTLKVHKITL